MMLKVNGAYLDFNGDIEIEKKIKLFEDIETTDGDISFAFELELTSHNIKTLKIPFPDVSSKRVYNIQDTEVFNDEGLRINKGSIRVESISGRYASCSFFGGNSNWFAMLNGNMTELSLSRYDQDLNETNIVDSWTNTSGIIYPLIDTGTLLDRGFDNAVTEDFVGCFYIHTLLKETFKQSGIKIQGELLNDPFFLSLIVVTNTRSKVDVDNNSIYIGTNVQQTITPAGDEDIIFNQFSVPFYVGENVDIDSNYQVNIAADMNAEIEVSVTTLLGSSGILQGFLRINGDINIARSRIVRLISFSEVLTQNGYKLTLKYLVRLEEGDVVTMMGSNFYGVNLDLVSATFQIKPVLIYKTFGRSSVPLWTKQEFVSNVFKLFNAVTSYDSFTKTITINIFDKIKQKTPLDISAYLTVDSVDYSEFIGNYGRSNSFKYQEPNDEDLREYNISGFLNYGDGVINVDNDFIQGSTEVLESDFSTPFSYFNSVFNGSLERINFVEIEEGEEHEITSVTNSGGVPRFNITDADDYFEVGNLVRLSTNVIQYNGDFVITAVTSTYITVRGTTYTTDATGYAIDIAHQLTTDDSVYIMSVIRQTDTNEIFDRNDIWINDTAMGYYSIAFFNLLRLGRNIEAKYKQGLSFGSIADPVFFQKTLRESYWTQFERIVNDPVMVKATGHLPWKVYNSLDFLSPVTLRTLETSNRYYINRMTGYRNSYTPCGIELIKLP